MITQFEFAAVMIDQVYMHRGETERERERDEIKWHSISIDVAQNESIFEYI